MTAKKNSSSSQRNAANRPARGAPAEAVDAIRLLVDDHDAVKGLFKTYEKLVKDEASVEEKQAVAQEICLALKAHTAIEEEIFYPAARDALDDDGMFDEAEVEHESVKDLIEQIEGMSPQEDLYDAKVTVLGEYIDHHVKEEETEMFPKVRKTDLDLKSLGDQMESRRDQLILEFSPDFHSV